MKKILLGTVVSFLAATPTLAQDYQVELGAVYLDGDSSGVDFDGYGLNAEFHLDKVVTTKGPLNEAAFLDKSSFGSLTWVTAEFDLANSMSADSDIIGLSGRFVTQSNLIIEASYLDIDTDFVGDDTAISLGVGTYINENMDLVVTYEDLDEADQSSLSVDVHGVNKLNGEASLAFDLGIAYLDENNDSGYGVSAGADYYLNKSLSFGAGLSLTSVDSEDVSSLGLRVAYFVTPVVGFGVSYETLGQDGDGDTIALSAAVRF